MATQSSPRRSIQHAPAAASIHVRYISDSRQRIEVYRKLAQANEAAAIESLKRELRDRFGPLPPAVISCSWWQGCEYLAAERHVTAIEVKADKLMLTRHQDYIMDGNKFPRLTRSGAAARLKEIKKFLLML